MCLKQLNPGDFLTPAALVCRSPGVGDLSVPLILPEGTDLASALARTHTNTHTQPWQQQQQ